MSIAWTGKELVAVGYDFNGGIIVTSRDAKAWTLIDSEPRAFMNCLAWGADRLVAVGAGGQIMTSINAEIWQSFFMRSPSGQPEPLNSVIWTGKQFFAGGDDGRLVFSDHGEDWNAAGFVESGIQSIAWTGRRIVVVRGDIYSSADGRNWTQQKLAGAVQPVLRKRLAAGFYDVGAKHVCWTGSMLTAVGGIGGYNEPSAGVVITSPDGTEWMERESGCPEALNFVTWAEDQFVAVGDKGIILTSPDGVIWSRQDSGTSSALRSVVLADGRLVAVGDGGTILASSE